MLKKDPVSNIHALQALLCMTDTVLPSNEVKSEADYFQKQVGIFQLEMCRPRLSTFCNEFKTYSASLHQI
jgi:hypothetical protein